MSLEETKYGHMLVVDTDVSISVTLRTDTFSPGTASADLIVSRDLEVDEWAGSRCWWISRVVVREKFRGQGIGTLLAERLLAVVKGTPTPIAIVSPGGYGADPERQFRFYARLGFTRVNEEGLMVWRPKL